MKRASIRSDRDASRTNTGRSLVKTVTDPEEARAALIIAFTIIGAIAASVGAAASVSSAVVFGIFAFA